MEPDGYEGQWCGVCQEYHQEGRHLVSSADIELYELVARVEAKVSAAFRNTLPPYMLPQYYRTKMPGMHKTTVAEALMDVWTSARDQVIEIIWEEFRERQESRSGGHVND